MVPKTIDLPKMDRVLILKGSIIPKGSVKRKHKIIMADQQHQELVDFLIRTLPRTSPSLTPQDQDRDSRASSGVVHTYNPGTHHTGCPRLDQEKKQKEESLDFVERMWKLPLVNAAYEYVSNKYVVVRDYPIVMANSVACKGLDYVENKFPIVKKSPEEIVAETKNAYNTVLESCVQSKVDFVKGKLVLAKVYGQVLKRKIEGLLDYTGNFIDTHVPVPEGVEYQPESVSGVKAGETQEKALLLSSKVKDLVVLHAQAQLQNLTEALQAVKSLKERASQQLNTVQTAAVGIYGEAVNRSKIEGTLEHRIVSTANHLLFTVTNTLEGVEAVMPVVVQAQIQRVRRSLSDLFNLLKSTPLKDLPAVLLTKAQEQIKDLYKYLEQSIFKKRTSAITNGSPAKSPK